MASRAVGPKVAAIARITEALNVSIERSGRDWELPSGQRLVLVYSKPQHEGRDFFVGLPNRLRDADALVVLLGSASVVFERAGSLLDYAPHMSRSSGGRPNPRFRATDDGLILSVKSLGIEMQMADRVDRFDRLLTPPALPPDDAERTLGRAFNPADEEQRAKRRPRLDVDLAEQDRATQGHARTLNRLSQSLRSAGIEPREAALGEPQYDLAWVTQGAIYVAEVKSLTDQNERQQLRLGLGQVLQYRRELLEGGRPALAVLAVERRPSDNIWLRLCHEVGVTLVWPRTFSALTSEPVGSSDKSSAKSRDRT